MDALQFEQLSEKEMAQIQGGAWVYCNDRWLWVETYGLGGDEEDQ